MAVATVPRPIHGALRSRIVARLAGVSVRQLQYWHKSIMMIEAHAVPGARGYPRLYSWEDYMKIRAVKKLLDAGVSTKRVRPAIEFLDQNVPDWYRLPLYGFAGRVLVDLQDRIVTADDAGQLALPGILRALGEEGPLGTMRRFSPFVDMHPDVLSGNPVVRGTRIETQVISELANRGLPAEAIAENYDLELEQVMQAIAFDRAAA